MRTGAMLAACCVLLAVPAAGAAGGPPDAYRDVAAWLRTLADGPPPGPPESAPRRLRLEARERLVSLGVGEDLAGALLSPAGGDPGDDVDPAREIQETAALLDRFADAMEREPPATPEGAAARVERILQDPVFRISADGPGLLERQLRRLRELMAGLVGRVLDFASNNGRMMVWITAMVAIGALLFFIVKFVVPLFVGGRDRPPRGFSTVRSAGRATRDPQELLGAAARELEAGRVVAAMKLLERAAILALQQRGLLPDRPGLTDLEGVAELRSRGRAEVGESFEALTALHERLVYAGRQGSAETLRRARELADRIVLPPGGARA